MEVMGSTPISGSYGQKTIRENSMPGLQKDQLLYSQIKTVSWEEVRIKEVLQILQKTYSS